jgi:hypothetical protein
VARLGATSELLVCRDQSQIVARNIDASAFPGAQVTDGVVSFTVLTSTQRMTLERIWQMGGEIVSVNPRRRTLEDIFLEATSQGSQARK